MATDLRRAKPSPPSKYDTFVSSQLAQAAKRIRLLDLTAGLLGFAALSLAYVVVMTVCDSKLMLSPNARQLSLYLFLSGSAVYLFFAVLRPLWLRVNPYFAARQMEQQLEHAKNSIVNWVDLHEQPLPPAIRGALGQRAAKDLAHADLERAISGRRTAWMGGLAGLFAVVFLVSYFLLGPLPFLSLLKRTFNPFGVVGVSTRTQLRLLKPEGGDAIVTVGRGVSFVVEVSGRVPDPKSADAVKLLYRYEEGDPWLERLLIQEPSREWTTSLSAIEVKNGFWYKISGGDAETAEHRIGVRAAPAILDFLATYHFRPYTARADELHRERELKALRGTEIVLRLRTNRTLRGGRLEFEGKLGPRAVPGEVDVQEPHTLLVRYIIDEDGKYRLFFNSMEGEAYSDPSAYAVTAIADQPPAVELTKPGLDIRLPADALLQLEGKASDDIGVKALVLRMRVVGGDKLPDRPYRSDEQLRLPDGGYPLELEYKDFIELSRVRGEDGQAVPLRAGMELDYWLEASDACDYPRPNVVQSKHYRVLLIEPEKNDPKQKQDKKQAEKDKKQHEEKQDQKRQQENQQRQQQRQEQQARNKEKQNKSQNENQGNQGAGSGTSQPKEGEQTDKSQGKQNDGQRGQSKGGEGGQGNGDQKSEQSKQEDQKIEDRIKKALEKKESGQKGKGEGKPDKSDRGEGKETLPNPSEGSGAADDKPKGENKSAGQPDAKHAAQGKEKGQPQTGGDSSRGDGKGDNSDAKKQTGPGKKEEGKQGGDPQKGKSDGRDKPQPKGKDRDSAKGDKTEKTESKPDPGAAARNATTKDINDLAKDLESKDARQREEAKRQLERIEKEAADAEARKQAGEALNKKGQRDDPADKGAQKKGDGPSDKEDGKRKETEKGNSKGDGKEDSGKEKSSDQKNGQAGKKGQGSSSADAPRGSEPSQGGNRPGSGSERRNDNNNRGDNKSPPQSKPDKPDPHRAAQMQLEDFAKKVNKDILKDAGVSEEEWQKYLQSRRKQLAPPDKPRPESASAPQQANQLPSMGGKTIQPAASGQGDASAPDRGQPPPQYRSSFRKFTEQMSKKN
jgi:hypothetical protein